MGSTSMGSTPMGNTPMGGTPMGTPGGMGMTPHGYGASPMGGPSEQMGIQSKTSHEGMSNLMNRINEFGSLMQNGEEQIFSSEKVP